MCARFGRLLRFREFEERPLFVSGYWGSLIMSSFVSWRQCCNVPEKNVSESSSSSYFLNSCEFCFLLWACAKNSVDVRGRGVNRKRLTQGYLDGLSGPVLTVQKPIEASSVVVLRNYAVKKKRNWCTVLNFRIPTRCSLAAFCSSIDTVFIMGKN